MLAVVQGQGWAQAVVLTEAQARVLMEARALVLTPAQALAWTPCELQVLVRTQSDLQAQVWTQSDLQLLVRAQSDLQAQVLHSAQAQALLLLRGAPAYQAQARVQGHQQQKAPAHTRQLALARLRHSPGGAKGAVGHGGTWGRLLRIRKHLGEPRRPPSEQSLAEGSRAHPSQTSR